MALQTTTPLEQEDIIDLYNDFNRLKEFVEELTGMLYDNNYLPEEFQHEVSSLYQKKFG